MGRKYGIGGSKGLQVPKWELASAFVSSGMIGRKDCDKVQGSGLYSLAVTHAMQPTLNCNEIPCHAAGDDLSHAGSLRTMLSSRKGLPTGE
jgi:hypothetical protein